jgi:glycosyltransferase involved in cell wall biosynthesis
MSVPTWHLLQRRPVNEQRASWDGYETHAIGAWLPELEFMHYFTTSIWKRLIDSCDAHLTVSGNALAAMPYYQTRRPFVAWLATGWKDDRKDRVRSFVTPRQIFDRAFVAPVVARLEAAILRSGSILSLSRYTQRTLEKISGSRTVRGILPMPVDSNFFSPEPESRVRGRIGFSGRLDDPRKNLDLLLESLACLRRAGHPVDALLIGGETDERLRRRLGELNIGDAVEFSSYVAPKRLRDLLRTLDVFVVPSNQEGLCIAALEAMACGCPLVSTRCGGPEEFVIDGETGFLVNFNALEMADAVSQIIGNEVVRQKLSDGARSLVASKYSIPRAEGIFWETFEDQFISRAKAA